MGELLRPPLLRLTIIGIVIGSIPMVGAWAASKWMIPRADRVGGVTAPGYKAAKDNQFAHADSLRQSHQGPPLDVEYHLAGDCFHASRFTTRFD